MEKINSRFNGQGKYFICLDHYKNEYLLVWDIDNDAENPHYMAKKLNKTLSLTEIKKFIISYYNTACDAEILNGLKFEGETVWLSTENQFNYKAAFDFAFQTVVTGGEYTPVTVKLGEDEAPVYKTFETFEDLQVFITMCFSHIQQTLDKYWQLKDSIDWSKYDLSV